MKTFKFLTVFLFTIISLASCKKDKEVILEPETTNEEMANEMVGTYIGSFTGNGVDVFQTYEITVERIDNQHIRLSGPDFTSFETILLHHPDASLNWFTNDVVNNSRLTLSYKRNEKELTWIMDWDTAQEHNFIGTKK